MTPVEYRIAVKAFEQRAQDERERDLTQAWRALQLQIEVANTKKLPSLEVVLMRARPRQIGAGLSISDFAMLSEHLGTPMRPASPEALDALRRMKES